MRGSRGARILATTIGRENFTNRFEEGTVAGKASRDYPEANLGMGPSGYWYVSPWKEMSEASEIHMSQGRSIGLGPRHVKSVRLMTKMLLSLIKLIIVTLSRSLSASLYAREIA